MVVRSIRTGVMPVSVVVTAAPMAPRATLYTTSISEVTIGKGELAFDVSGVAGFNVAPGTRVRASAAGGVTDWAEGPVVSFDGKTVVIDTRSPVGLLRGEGGTFDNWHIGVIGEPGMKGEVGLPGPQGARGPATIRIEDTITSVPGDPALVMNLGDDDHARLQFTIPRGAVGPPGAIGPQGDAATITVRNTTASAPGGPAEVTNFGNQHQAVFDFVIPRGEQGTQGPVGPPGIDGVAGPTGPQGIPGPTTITIGTVDTIAAGQPATITNSGTTTNLVLDFELPKGDKGDVGVAGGWIGAVAAPFNVDTGHPSGGELQLSIAAPLEIDAGVLKLLEFIRSVELPFAVDGTGKLILNIAAPFQITAGGQLKLDTEAPFELNTTTGALKLDVEAPLELNTVTGALTIKRAFQ